VEQGRDHYHSSGNESIEINHLLLEKSHRWLTQYESSRRPWTDEEHNRLCQWVQQYGESCCEVENPLM
jgi:hypothetical protein